MLAAVAGEPQPATVLAPGYGELEFDAPAPGSYRLPPLGAAGDGDVIDSDARPLRLHDLLGDKLTVLSFIYSSCSDVNGCPLATFVLAKTRKRLAEQPDLDRQVRFISLSFDPVKDTPEVMRDYGARFRQPASDWRFLTTADESALAPILEQYGQIVQNEIDEDGRESGAISHVLRVYLVDRERRIRNIYSASFLHPETLVNDLRTVSLEEHGEPSSLEARGEPPREAGLQGAGDFKDDYHTGTYQTRARSLAGRTGQAVDLAALAKRSSLGLPARPGPAATAEQIALGRKLFFDRRLSFNNTVSCAMCHIPEQGFTHNELATAVGFEGRSVRRNAPTLYNVAYQQRLFHDARESRLEQQVWSPLLGANEMANPSIGYVIDQLKALADYQGRFETAFAGKGPDMATIGAALASYERVLVAGDSAFDRWYYGKRTDALADGAVRGFELFTGKAGCSACHLVDEEQALFTDHALHNTGIGYARSMGEPPGPRTVPVAPGTTLDVDLAVVAEAAEPRPNDLGRYEISQDPADRWKYKTPSLRNVALTAPYMHDGSLATLRDVVAFYNRGGVANPLLDPLIRPLGLNDGELEDLVAFLESLTGANVDTLVSDAFAASVGNVTASEH